MQRVGFVASELARAGTAVVAAPIAPHEAGRQAVRDAVENQAGPGSNFFLIHVATPVEYCEKTDRRGVYAQARNGSLKGLSGVDEDFEVPKDANLTVDLTEHNIPQVVHSALFIESFTLPCL
jgi:sulfate adenylyltransferase